MAVKAIVPAWQESGMVATLITLMVMGPRVGRGIITSRGRMRDSCRGWIARLGPEEWREEREQEKEKKRGGRGRNNDL